MNKLFICLLLTASTTILHSQSLNKIITSAEVEKIENILSADSMAGRKAFTPAANKAADFISGQFKQIGLKTLPGASGFKQNFSIVSPKVISVEASIDSNVVDSKKVIPFSTIANVTLNERSGFATKYIKAGDQFRKEVGNYLKLTDNLLVFVDTSFAQSFYRLNFMKQHLFKSEKSVVFVLGNFAANSYNINITQQLTEERGSNVVGVLPGKSKKQEFVVFSGHYDHIGTKSGSNGDTIFNGANDDASGITAIIQVAKYYKAAHNNERTLVFSAFTAEEAGGFGSQYFSRQIPADKVVAMLNIEMIGTESKWGKNSAYITGFEKSNLGEILQKNLKGTNFQFYPDPYTEQNLFYRSDNATLARLGVPAHTISTSKMDSEPNYHKVSDEVKTLDLDNMTQVIQSIILSAGSIVNGKDTPTRVKADDLTR